MILEKDQLLDEWTKVKQSAAASPDAITVLILAALDVDAVATSAMLTARIFFCIGYLGAMAPARCR